MRGWLIIVVFLLVGADARGGDVAVSERALEIESRPGVSTAFYLTEPAAPPAAIVILLAGGDGSLGIRPGEAVAEPVAFGRGNFLVRSRWLLAGKGLLVATMDAPSDQGRVMTAAFRLSDDHLTDMAALAAWLKREHGGLPVWLIGTSMGTLSAASAASKFGGGIGGVILTSSITRGHPKYSYPSNGVLGLGPEAVTVPVMVVAHAGDACELTPPSDAPSLLDSMVKSPRRQLLLVEGGAPARSGACQAMAPHGFFGREGEVVAAMAAFIMPSVPH